MAQQQNVKSIRTENWHILPVMLPLSPGSWFCWHRHYPYIIEGEFCPAHRATQALVLMLKDAMVPVNKGVVSYNQTFMFAQAFHKGFPLWSFPLYPRPTRMQTPSYGKDSQKGWEENIASPLFFFVERQNWGNSDSRCVQWRAPLQTEQMDWKLPAF